MIRNVKFGEYVSGLQSIDFSVRIMWKSLFQFKDRRKSSDSENFVNSTAYRPLQDPSIVPSDRFPHPGSFVRTFYKGTPLTRVTTGCSSISAQNRVGKCQIVKNLSIPQHIDRYRILQSTLLMDFHTLEHLWGHFIKVYLCSIGWRVLTNLGKIRDHFWWFYALLDRFELLHNTVPCKYCLWIDIPGVSAAANASYSVEFNKSSSQ